MRSADAAARGTITNIIVAIITDIRIWMMYARKAVRLPIGISPASTRWPPNQITATPDRFMISMRLGIIRANSRLTFSAVDVRSAFASSNRRSSCSVRTNARMTRMPDSCSRSTWLTRSILTCMTRNSGMARDISSPMTTAITGTMTSSRADSGMSCRSAITIPPMHMMGAVSITVRPISTSICSC